MAYTYEYTGDVATVFVSLQKEGHTWVPEHGDTITTAVPVAHPLLKLVSQSEDVVADTPAVVEVTEVSTLHPRDKKSTVPAVPEVHEPATADESEEN